jgi:predicted nucleic-acid-binding Zn-ribbon protein
MLSLKDGVCPQCGSERIRSGAAIEGKEGLRGGNRIPINAVIQVALDNYVCVDCGYVESYISDRSILNSIAKEWAKVEPKDSD